jgi:serine/threonine protein kinase/Tol biopolymer transport system component
MLPERRDLISDLYHRALARAPEERAAFLAEACKGDEALREEVQSLLEFEPASARLLERPAVAVAAGATSATSMIDRQLGPYTIVAPLGAGGMGEVYRARDSRLGRDVAIKILPAHFTADSERRARFAREARLLATLNHPHIGAIYGLEESAGVSALVLELVEGETLAARLERGPLPLAGALAIARQIAEALEAAHEKGIVHRDLKPANIVLQGAFDGVSTAVRAKVLDFGLARPMAVDLAGPTAPASGSFGGTADGRILGTPAYMSPEQARGLTVDKRSDIWAFGCVLFEMLSGRRAFDGATITDTLACILDHQPDWAALPADTPAPIRTLLERCLRKDPKRRLHDIADALIEMEEGALPTASAGARLSPARSGSRRYRDWLPWTVAAVLGMALITMAWSSRRVAPTTPGDVVEFPINPPGQMSQLTDRFAISPDGRHVAFTARSEGHSVLYVRSLETLELRMLAGTEGALYPFWRPDSQAIGFFAAGQIKTIQLSGGVPVSVCRGTGEGTWNQADVIVFGGASGYLGGVALQRVSARGGTPSAVTSLKDDEFAHGFPSFLPDGEHFLYLAQSSASSELRVGSLTSAESVPLGPFESNAQYAAGSLFFVRGGSLIAQPFDADTYRLKGSPSYMAAKVGFVLNHGMFSVSATGRLAYTVGSASQTLTWLDRQGNTLSTVGDPGTFFNMDLSPDEQHVAISKAMHSPGARATVDLWRIDLARSALATRLTDHPGWEWDPDWLRNDTIAFTHALTPGGDHGLFVRAPDPSGPNTLLLKSGNIAIPDWSHDGRFIVYTEGWGSNPDAHDLWTLSTTPGRSPTVFLKTRHDEGAGRFSPDDRWIAYRSNASGRSEVYVRPFPVRPGEFAISRDGGRAPRWRGDGKEIFFLSLDGTMMAAQINTTKGFAAGIPQKLFATPLGPGGNPPYSVTKDGQRFLMPIPGPPAPIVVLLNWHARLAH